LRVPAQSGRVPARPGRQTVRTRLEGQDAWGGRRRMPAAADGAGRTRALDRAAARWAGAMPPIRVRPPPSAWIRTTRLR